MGHPLSNWLNKLKDIISLPQNDIAHICDILSLAEKTPLPSSYSSISNNAHFDLIHCDI